MPEQVDTRGGWLQVAFYTCSNCQTETRCKGSSCVKLALRQEAMSYVTEHPPIDPPIHPQDETYIVCYCCPNNSNSLKLYQNDHWVLHTCSLHSLDVYLTDKSFAIPMLYNSTIHYHCLVEPQMVAFDIEINLSPNCPFIEGIHLIEGIHIQAMNCYCCIGGVYNSTLPSAI